MLHYFRFGFNLGHRLRQFTDIVPYSLRIGGVDRVKELQRDVQLIGYEIFICLLSDNGFVNLPFIAGHADQEFDAISRSVPIGLKRIRGNQSAVPGRPGRIQVMQNLLRYFLQPVRGKLHKLFHGRRGCLLQQFLRQIPGHVRRFIRRLGIALEHKRFPEEAFRLFTGRQQTDGDGAGRKAHHGDPVGVAAEGRYVFFDPFQGRNLIQQPKV